jgi:phosphatidylglycerol:prolipoprotein diacylglycerol transferase
MSFHGGFLGVLVAIGDLLLAARQALDRGDGFRRAAVPARARAGRLGNFINGELPGRPTTVPWGMWFPQVDPTPIARPSLAALPVRPRGLLLFAILLVVLEEAAGPPGRCRGIPHRLRRPCASSPNSPASRRFSSACSRSGMSMGQWLSIR